MHVCVMVSNFQSPDPCCRAEFKEIRLLGTGNFSKVYLAQHRLDGVNYAVKRSAHRVCSDAAKRQWVQVSTSSFAKAPLQLLMSKPYVAETCATLQLLQAASSRLRCLT